MVSGFRLPHLSSTFRLDHISRKRQGCLPIQHLQSPKTIFMPALHCSKRIGSDWQYPRVSLVVPAGNQHLSACSHLVIGGRRQDAPIHASNFGPMAAFPCTVELVAITPADQNQGCPLLSVSSACHPQRTLFHAAQENERPSAGSRV